MDIIDTSIATINATKGLITPIKEGEVKFTATSIGLGYTGKYITYESGIVQILEDTAIPKVRMESKEDMVQIFDTQASADEREADGFATYKETSANAVDFFLTDVGSGVDVGYYYYCEDPISDKKKEELNESNMTVMPTSGGNDEK